MPYTECKHCVHYEAQVIANVGVFYRMRLGLAPDEVAAIVQVCFVNTPNESAQFWQALSPDPDEEANLAVLIVRNDQNMIAIRGFFLLGVAAQGPVALDTLVVPIPGGGIDVAGDVTYLMAATLNVPYVTHACSVYYQRRKAQPGEREALIMAQR